MATIICASCNDEVTQNPKLKRQQQKYCSKAKCQKSRKSAWKREKMMTCPEFRVDHALANKKWARSSPGYWRKYRFSKPVKADRNRLLQQLRNQRLRPRPEPINCKGRRVNIQINQLFGQFWLVPVIAKVDAIKVNIETIRAG